MCHPLSLTAVHQRMMMSRARTLCRGCIPLGSFCPAPPRKKVPLQLSIQQIKPKWLQLHSLTLSLMSSTRWVTEVPATAMPAHVGQHQSVMALMSSHGSRGLSTNGPVQWGCHQPWTPCHLLGRCYLAWIWKHMGKFHGNQTKYNKSIEVPLLLLKT